MVKKYNLAPEEFVIVTEPSYGEKRVVAGFSEEEIRETEERLGVRIPSAYRHYLKVCGKASLNQELHRLLPPSAKEFGICFSYDLVQTCIEEEWLSEWEEEGPDPENPFYQIHQLPREEWGKITGNYLVIWIENQGCFHAGIRVEDLNQDNPAVYITTDDSYFEWQQISNSTQSFLLSMLMEAVYYRADDTLEGDEEIQKYFQENEVDTKELLPKEAPFLCSYIRTFLDASKHVFGLYLLENENGTKPAKLHLFKLPDGLMFPMNWD